MSYSVGDQEEDMDTSDNSANNFSLQQRASDVPPVQNSANDDFNLQQPLSEVSPVRGSGDDDGNLQQPVSDVSPVQSGKISSQNKDEDEALLSISFKWSESIRPQKPKRELQRLLQSWFNNRERAADCTVVKTIGDDCVVIEITPVPALSELTKLHGQKLSMQGCSPITITSVPLIQQEQNTDIPEETSLNSHPSMSQPQAGSGDDDGNLQQPLSDVSPVQSGKISSQNKDEDEALLSISFKWSESIRPQKPKRELQLLLQSWFNNRDGETDCTVVKIVGDDFAVIKIKPVPALDELTKLNGKKVTRKGCRPITITSVPWMLQEQNTDIPEETSLNSHPSMSQPQAGSGDDDGNLQQPVSDVSPVQTRKISIQNKNEDEARLTISFKWSESDRPQKPERDLQLLLQSWFNNRERAADCTVVKTIGDDCVVIEIKPVPALSELTKLHGQKLSMQGCSPITITSVSLILQELDTDVPEEASLNPRPSMSQPQAEQVEQRSTVSAVGEETCSCSVPVSHFWYVNHIYGEKLKRIQKENGVQLMADVTVTFVPENKDGDPEKALSEFTNLVQDCLNESTGSVIPLKYVDPDQWSEALKVVQKNEKKLLLTLSSDKIIVCGPSSSQNDFSRTLNAMQKTNVNAALEDYEWPSEETPLMIDMTADNPLITSGLIIKENNWKLLTTSYDEQVEKIKAKFNVDLRESSITQGKVSVKAFYRGAGANTSMESHAVRALVHLYQKIATSPMSFIQLQGATGISSSLKNSSSDYQSEGASNDAEVNGRPGFSMKDTKAPTGGGAEAGDDEDKTCPICMDAFTNKQQLKCKHAFCKGCLQQAKEILGPTCPVCKDVFGVIEGDQPDGKMTWITYVTSLPGFSDCGTIVITYDIPGGRQTGKHPKPGQYYHGINRTAYLPDNKEGKEVLRLLKQAFDQKLIFTVRMSRITGLDNQVTWNDIHHKTSTTGGPQSFGYPDPDYLSRVKEELKAKGIK